MIGQPETFRYGNMFHLDHSMLRTLPVQYHLELLLQKLFNHSDVKLDAQDPEPLPYLRDADNYSYDVELNVLLQTKSNSNE